MRAFIRRHLDPATRLGEVLFGLIMALGITGAVQFELAEPNNREMFIAVLGCNLAWGIVDGVMFAMLSLFERSRKSRIVRHVQHAVTDDVALAHIRQELGDTLEPLMSAEEYGQIYRWVLNRVRRAELPSPHVQWKDILGGIAIGVLIFIATLPVVVPFLIFSNPTVAVRISNLIALVLLFVLGWWWGRAVGASPFGVGAGVTTVGLTLVLITIVLGG